MKFILLLALITPAFASNVVGVMMDEGKTLSVTIVDGPALPHTAGDLWSAMKEQAPMKAARTSNLQIICAGTTQSDEVLGNCKLRFPASKSRVSGNHHIFSISKKEAEQMLGHFQPSRKHTIKLVEEESGDLLFGMEADPNGKTIALRVHKKIILN